MLSDMYGQFAVYYDRCMEGVPYKKWASNIKNIWDAHGADPRIVLDLCCGTGVLTRMFADMGYDMIGADISEDMLARAAEFNEDGRVLYLKQDIRNLELFGSINACYSVFDSMNYMTDAGDFIRALKNVNMYLEPGGMFIFDVNSDKKYIRMSSENPPARVLPEFSYIWEYSFDRKSRINECAAHFFTLEKSGLYRRFTEYHYQKAYNMDEIETAVKTSGLYLTDILDAGTMKAPGDMSERLYAICTKPNK